METPSQVARLSSLSHRQSAASNGMKHNIYNDEQNLSKETVRKPEKHGYE